MFSEHLSPEAKPRGHVWVNAIGGVCKVWSRLQGAAAACLNEHCLYYTGLGKNGMSGSPLPGSQLIE